MLNEITQWIASTRFEIEQSRTPKNRIIQYSFKSRPSIISIRSIAIFTLIFLFIFGYWFSASSSNSTTTSATSAPESSSPLKIVDSTPTTGAPSRLNVNEKTSQDADSLPTCRKSDPKFNGISAFECDSIANTTFHYEYFADEQSITSTIQEYQLSVDPKNPNTAIRTGLINGRNRLLAIMANEKLLIDINSELDQETLDNWWQKYLPMSTESLP